MRTEATRRRPRLRTLLLAVATVAVGAGCRFLLPDPFGDVAGGLLYTVLLCWLVVLIWPSMRSIVAAGIAAVVAAGLELLQLTPVPAAVSSAFPPARLVLGTTFGMPDLVVAVLGGVLAWALDRVVLRLASRRASR